ncbi:hypothetical protein [Streptomyces sp. NPDC088847]|uniref:hypothetical protein n=1 Tax=Streptomyces sp. NPDC088847 TaxID=3365909 RepID=UPI0037FB4369
MEKNPLDLWADGDEGPVADAPDSRDLVRAIHELEGMVSELEGADSQERKAEEYRRIRRTADWIRAACGALIASTDDVGDLPDALDAWGDLEPGEVSHAMLIATLMTLHGSHVVPMSILTPDTLAGRDGALHAAALELLPSGSIRISVCPRPEADSAGAEFNLP